MHEMDIKNIAAHLASDKEWTRIHKQIGVSPWNLSQEDMVASGNQSQFAKENLLALCK